MTTYEHAMLGIDGTLALGLHRSHGWKIAAMAGLAAIAPDWDGLTILYSKSLFADAHRVWGHNVFACILLGLLIGLLDYRCDIVARLGALFTKLCRVQVADGAVCVRTSFASKESLIWTAVAIVSALSQLPADMVVSGSQGLPDWELKVLWPFSSRGWVYPMVPWGDPGITIVFVAGMFGMLKFRERIQQIAAATLLGVVGYIAIRGTIS